MKPALRQLMLEIGQLSGPGRLQEATELLQQRLASALGGRGRAGGGVFDVEARAPSPGVASPEDACFLAAEATHAGVRRPYRLYVPQAATETPRPLVVMLHGCLQDPDDFARGTRMNEHARRAGCLVLYPGQIAEANGQRCWNWFQPSDQQRGRGEPHWIAALTRDVMARWPVDPRQVYIAGLSAGGAMAATLAAAYPELYAAVGVHSGLPPRAAHDLATALSVMRGAAAEALDAKAAPLPLIVLHGDRDATVHPCNAQRLLDAALLARHDLPPAPDELETDRVDRHGRQCSVTRWRPGGGAVRAEHWLVHGAAHAWFGGHPAGSFTDPAGPDASAELLRFFLSHPRP